MVRGGQYAGILRYYMPRGPRVGALVSMCDLLSMCDLYVL